MKIKIQIEKEGQIFDTEIIISKEEIKYSRLPLADILHNNIEKLSNQIISNVLRKDVNREKDEAKI